MMRTTISLPDALAAQLDREARRRETSVSEIVRRAIAAYLQFDSGGPREIPFAGLGESGFTTTARDHEEILRSAWAGARRR